MKLKTKIFAVAFMITGFFSYSQDAGFDSICKALTSHAVTKGDFVQKKTSGALKKPVVSSGKYIISDLGILWDTKKPFASRLAVTKNLMIQTLPSGKKNIMDGTSNEVFKTVSQTLESLFSGSKNELEKSFDILDFNFTDAKWSLALAPKDKTVGAVLKRVELSGAVLKKDASLDAMKIVQNENDFTSYEFTNQTYVQELTDEEKFFFKE